MKLLLFIATCTTSAICLGQTPIIAEVDKDVVAVNEQFTYVLTSTKNCEIAPPRFRGLQIVAGPMQGQSSFTEIVNGVKTQTNEYTFTWYLKAKEMGIYTIEAADMQCKKKTYSSEEIKIKVASDEEIATLREGVAEHYLTLEASKSEVYQGEPFILSLKFYSKKRPTDVENYVHGVASGLERQDLRKPTDVYKIMQENVKGTRYYVIELKRELAIPLRTGEIEIEPYYGSMWFDQGIFESYRLDGYTNGLTIISNPIPVDPPEDDIGLVGDFRLEFEKDKNELKANQSLEMRMTLSGTGNFNSFDPPAIYLPDGLELFTEPDIQDTIVPTETGLSGSRTYVYTIMAKKKGTYGFEPFNFSYFNTRTTTYDSLFTGPIKLKVRASSKRGVEDPREILTVDTTDIRFIHTDDATFFHEDEFIYGTMSYYVSVGSPLALAVLAVFFIRRRANLSDVEKLAQIQKAAKKSSINVLKEAKAHLANGDQGLALKSLQSSMFGFFTRKLNIQMSELSKAKITTNLKEKAVSDDSISQFEDCWSRIEMAQYAPVDADNINIMISDTENLISSLNSQI